jgi:hypothetical protein
MNNETQSESEPVATTVQALPFVDIYMVETNTGTEHLLNASKAYKERLHKDGETTTVTSMCGCVDIEIPVQEELDESDNLTHLREVVTKSQLADDASLMNHPQRTLEDCCQSCRGSWKSAFDSGDYRTVRYEM